MQTALRNAGEAVDTVLPSLDRRAENVREDVMVDPLHPMHQELLARFSTPPIAQELSVRPPRLAIPFYAAVAAWGVVWLIFEAGATLL